MSISDEDAPLSILHVVTRSQRRGAEASAFELAERLRVSGRASTVVALAPETDGAHLPVDVLGSRPLGLRTLWRLRGRLRLADVVIAHGSRTLPAVGIASAGLGTTAIYQNIGDPRFWAGRPLRRLRVATLLSRMRAVAALTPSSADILVAEFGVRRERTWVIPNWRDGTRFRPPDAGERRDAREALGLAGAAPVVAMVGALSVEKDVDLAVRSLALLPDFRLVVAGEGPERPRLETESERLAQGRVRFLGSLDDVRPVLHAADVFLLTSTSEGVPGVLIEAGLCGLPVVTVDVGFVRDVICDGTTGVTVSDRRPEAVAAALRRAYDDRAGLGIRARERCLANFDTEHVVRRWLHLLETVGPSNS